MKKTPTGVKVIAILYYIAAASLLLTSLGLLFGGSAILATISDLIPNITGAIIIGAGVATLIIGILFLILGLGLWKGNNIARITVIVLAIIGLIGNVNLIFSGQSFGIPNGIVQAIINIIIAWYLIANKEVKKTFA